MSERLGFGDRAYGGKSIKRVRFRRPCPRLIAVARRPECVMTDEPTTRVRRLRVVAVNDVHVLDELPRLASLVQAARTRDPADCLLVTVAGDFLAPSLLSSLDEGRGMVDCLNALGVTHVTLGNHEDDLEPEDLLARLEELNAEVLLTNAVDFRGRHVVSDIVDVGGAPVGLVGVVNGDPGLYRRLPLAVPRSRAPTTPWSPRPRACASRAASRSSRSRTSGCATTAPSRSWAWWRWCWAATSTRAISRPTTPPPSPRHR
ncbi:MAG: metallophosphoesterase [Sandaracinaceae bacterium]|nr:metallophosphoesterase [Sandaracinaceae bacterium]